jgi:hypothetical protein
MFLAYLIAGIFAALAGYLLFRPEMLPYWRKRDPIMLRIVMGVMCLSRSALAVAVTVLALGLGWRWGGTGELRAVEDGLTYGFVSVTLLYLDFSGPGLEVILPARWLLRLYERRIDPFLTAGADRSVRRRLGDLKPEQLVDLSNELYARHVGPGLGKAVVEEDRRRLVSLQTAATSRGDDHFDQYYARAALTDLRIQCELTIVEFRDHVTDIPDPCVPRHGSDA